MSAMHVTDVAMISDFRLPGGTSQSVSEEITAQHSAGISTALVHVNGPLVGRVRGFHPAVAAHVRSGRATLVVDGDVHASVVTVRHPAVLEQGAAQLPRITADHVVIIANAGPTDIDGRAVYDVARTDQVARDHFGVDPVWAPIGPLVREAIADDVPAGRLAPADWVNIIDVDAWSAERPVPPSTRPVVGRHSRPSPQKWPADAQTLRAVYPTDGSWEVRVLGGARPVADLLGTVPSSWTVHEFGDVPPAEFLAGLDFFVYYHDPRWVEAFGRTIVEAMASGALAVLPPHFRVLFGDGAVYAEPHEVRAVVDRLHHDRDAYGAQVDRARSIVRDRFSHGTHVARLSALLTPREPEPGLRPSGGPAAAPDDGPRLLMVSSNGAGMGHLTRLLSYARQVEDGTTVSFLSMSQAVPVAGRMGHDYEYLPSAKALGMPPGRWREMFVGRVTETLRRRRPDVVVFDGTWPYPGVEEIREQEPSPRWVWSRRGMWRRGLNVEQVRKAAWFDAVLEPGDLAAARDRGATVDAPSHKVRPVTLLDREDLDDRARARAELGLPADGPLALVSLGAGNINDTGSQIGAAAAALRTLGVGMCVTVPEIAGAGAAVGADVHLVRDYPLSRRYRAFDLAIAASGYNSFHELLRFGTPTLFVPNRATSLDDQEGRAEHAAAQGWAHQVADMTDPGARDLLADLLDAGPSMATRAAAADPGNGGTDAARFLIDVAGGGGR
ncbi:hypothetical protein [Cellulomonas bogoriensis]|uniref:UDP-N-acetylglucosamine:LPS N-acetylglucosamine transferase n=1 Tax=Cellulomonas bogoriensis 69B4 = DSM 16987 TaxID=1386082 RepID=A0A0A0BMX5_9CELL|nr:hypothetical protein [Cellulomonas bogoriensis]KGM09301.1 UDP-N-acetylglucosamine:LPS N-acetylglucosamine transferase [Cellulomonas bogoriensis 69B4 = DSM 16987]